MVAMAHGGDEEVRRAVVVDVDEGGGDADLVLHGHAGFGGDVLELAVAEVLPELVLAELGDEVDVEQAVAVDVRHGDAVAVVVVHRLVGAAAVVGLLVAEGDAALGLPVGELEFMEDADLAGGGELGGLAGRQGRDALVVLGEIEAGLAVGMLRAMLHLSEATAPTAIMLKKIATAINLFMAGPSRSQANRPGGILDLPEGEMLLERPIEIGALLGRSPAPCPKRPLRHPSAPNRSRS